MLLFSGLEFDYVILSTAYSLPKVSIETYIMEKWLTEKLGALSEHGLVITALTRARKALVIVGRYTCSCLIKMDFFYSFHVNQPLL